MKALPSRFDDFAPGVPPIERVARWSLHDELPRFRFDIVDEGAARAFFEAERAGANRDVVPDLMARRTELLRQEIERVNRIVQMIAEVTSLALCDLGERPEEGP